MIRTRNVPTIESGAQCVIPGWKLAYHTPDRLQAMKPSRCFSADDLRRWIGSATHYNPITHYVLTVVAGKVRHGVTFAPLVTNGG